MIPKVDKWYKYECKEPDRYATFLFDIFKIVSIRKTNGLSDYHIFKQSLVGEGKEWFVTKEYWNTNVRELSNDELMVEVL